MDNSSPINRHKNKMSDVNSNSNNKEEAVDEFASAFPKWDLVPPAIVIRRVRRGI